jgi:hypothetical protein
MITKLLEENEGSDGPWHLHQNKKIRLLSKLGRIVMIHSN